MPRKKVVFRTPWFSIEREQYPDDPSLKGKPFYRLVVPDGVSIFAMTRDKKIILVKQFRPALNTSTLEFPAGDVEQGESPQKAVARELYEETGYRAHHLELLGVRAAQPSRANQRIHIFFAQGVAKDHSFRPREQTETVAVSPLQLKKLVKSGALNPLISLGVLLLALAKHPECGIMR